MLARLRKSAKYWASEASLGRGALGGYELDLLSQLIRQEGGFMCALTVITLLVIPSGTTPGPPR